MFEIVGDAEVAAAARRLGAFNATARMVGWADRYGPRLQRRMRERAPRGQGPHSGRLADSVRYQRETGIGFVRLKFHSNVPYAEYVVKGTRPHEIVPRAALALHWTTPGGGSVFAKRVRHPGTRANDFPRRALHDLLPEMTLGFHSAFNSL